MVGADGEGEGPNVGLRQRGRVAQCGSGQQAKTRRFIDLNEPSKA